MILAFMKRPMFAMVLGTIGAFGMGPFYIWPATLLSLALYWVHFIGLNDRKPWVSFLSGFLYGFGYFLGSLWWIGNALLIDGNPFIWAYPLAVCGLPALLALFPMMAIGLTRLLSKNNSLFSFAIYLTLMLAAEWGRCHLFTGFPWNLYGMTWTGSLAMLQILSTIGIGGLSALTLICFSVVGYAFGNVHSKPLKIFVMAIAALPFGAIYIYGQSRLDAHPTQYDTNTIVQMIQPNILQAEKWNGDKVWDNFRQTLSPLTQDITQNYTTKPQNRFVVLPETAITYHHLATPQAREALQGRINGYDEKNLYILTGALMRDDAGYHNSLITLNRDAEIISSFDKFHLVPFGEYMPLSKYIPLGPLVGFESFVEGDGPHTIAPADGVPPFSPLVCYEVIFSGHVVAHDGPPPKWIVNVTNDAWYGISAGPFQHLAHAQYRAIEEGLPVVRVANTGISAVFDAYGRPVLTTGLFHEANPETLLPMPSQETMFVRLNRLINGMD